MEQVDTFLAVLEAGSLDGAATLLGVNHSTVYRRLQRLEDTAGGPLFDRQGACYLPTPFAHQLSALAIDAREAHRDFLRGLTARRDDVGEVRCTLPLGVHALVAPGIVRFRRAHPEVSLTVEERADIVDLARGDADVALRIQEDPDPDLLGRRIAPVGWAVYARRRASLTELPWVVQHPRHRERTPVRHQRATWPDVDVAYVADGLTMVMDLLHSDDVAGYAPCYLADRHSALVRISEVHHHGFAWVLYPEALRGAPLAKAFVDALYDAAHYRRRLFDGRSLGSPTGPSSRRPSAA